MNRGGSGSQVTAVPNTGYHFVQWSDGVTTAARTDTNVMANINVTASFAEDTGPVVIITIGTTFVPLDIPTGQDLTLSLQPSKL